MTLNETKKMANLGRLAVFGTAVVWGSSVVVLKNTLDSIGPLHILAFRFTVSAILLLPFCITKFREIDAGYLKNGFIMGLFLFLSNLFQTYGLMFTTPGKNAFLAATYCVIVPFLCWPIYKRRPDAYNILAAFLAISGIGLVSLDDNLSLGKGELLTTCCSFFIALHIISTARGIKGRNALLLSMIQFAVVGVLSWIPARIFEPFPTNIPSGALTGIIYLCVMCTAVCFLLQTFGQKHTPAESAAIIMSMECVIATIFSVIFYHEPLNFRIVLGFVIIFAAVLISETKLGFLKRRGAKSAE